MATVELVFVTVAEEIIHHRMNLEAGTRVADAIKESGIWTTHPETKNLPFGIYSKPASLDTVLKDGDRIEFYRALVSSPKQKRRERAR